MDVTVSLRSTCGEVLGRGCEVAVHLQAQLAGGDDDERARDAGQLPFGVGGDPLQQRHTEREGLAHTGAGLADEIVARQRQRHGQFLDSKRVFLAVLGQCPHDFVANSEFSKCWVEMRHTRRLSLSIVNPHGVHARTSSTKLCRGPALR